MIETKKMLEPGTKVRFVLSMNPKFKHRESEGVVVGYPRKRGYQAIPLRSKNNKLNIVFNPVLLIRIKTWRLPLGRRTWTVNARGVTVV